MGAFWWRGKRFDCRRCDGCEVGIFMDKVYVRTFEDSNPLVDLRGQVPLTLIKDPTYVPES